MNILQITEQEAAAGLGATYSANSLGGCQAMALTLINRSGSSFERSLVPQHHRLAEANYNARFAVIEAGEALACPALRGDHRPHLLEIKLARSPPGPKPKWK